MTYDELRRASCEALRGAQHRLADDDVAAWLRELPGWSLLDDGRIGRDFRFDDFAAALAFTNALGWMAERENHHPDLELGWGYLRVRFATHDVDGLSRNDFICAAKASALFAGDC